MANYNQKSIQTTLFIIILIITATLALTTESKQPNDEHDFVTAHNLLRQAVGVGPIKWNETLAKYARSYANLRVSTGCKLVHSNGPYGENLAEGWGEMTGDVAVNYWATEKPYYVHSSNRCLRDVCGHYTQIVWRNSVRLGCARVRCPSQAVFVICTYDPPGNYIGERPY